jgi:hypothetical protein
MRAVDFPKKVAAGTVKKSIDASEPTWSSRNVRKVCDGGFRGLGGMKRDTLPIAKTGGRRRGASGERYLARR